MGAPKSDPLAIWDTLTRAHPALLARPFVNVPVVGADPPGPTLLDLYEMIHAALAWAGLDTFEIEIVDVREPFVGDWRLAHPRVELVAIEDRRLVFQVEHMGARDVLLAAVCHEVARAFVAVAGAGGPYRETDRLAGWSESDELTAGVAGVLLGFALPLMAWGRGARAVGEIVGRSSVTRQVAFLLGPLDTDELAVLTARRLAARGRVDDDVAHTLGQLDGTPKDLLVRELACTPPVAPKHVVAPVAFEAPPLPAPVRARIEELEAAHQKPHRGRVGRLYTEKKTVTDGMIATLLALLPGIFLAIEKGALGLLVVPGAGALGALLGSRRTIAYCAACWVPARRKATTCEKCGITYGARVPLSERDGDEDEDDDLTRQALATPPPD